MLKKAPQPLPCGRGSESGLTGGRVAVEIRAPHQAEWPACRMLLPRAFESPRAPEVLLAFDENRITGGVAWRSRGDLLGIFDLRVVRTERRKGIGACLLRNLCERAAAGGQRSASIFIDSLANPDASPFLTANGFERKNRLFVVEADTRVMLAGLRKIRDRLMAAGKIPPGARLVKPSEAPMDEVIRLFDRYILAERAMRPEFFLATFGSDRFEESSVILLVEGRVAGFVMVEWLRDHGRGDVVARVVVPDYRGGWANVFMMALALERGIAAGFSRVRFESLEDNADTLSLARRYHADTVHVLDRFLRRL